MKWIVAVLVTVVAAGCLRDGVVANAPFDHSVDIRNARGVRFPDGATLQLDSVSDDSRCPIDVTCFWEGNARVWLTLTTANRRVHHLTLNTAGGAFRRDTVVDAYHVFLEALKPEPVSTKQIAQSEYIASVRVRK